MKFRGPGAGTLFLATAFGLGLSGAAAIGCATARAFARVATSTPETGGPSGISGTARVAETVAAPTDTTPGRTLATPHFVLHYTLAPNVHQPVWTPADAGLKRLRDSLYAPLAADTTRRDSLLNAKLDSLGAGHPVFIQHAAAYFENAYAYYVDTLGMIPTDSNRARFFKGTVPGKYNVEIGDIQRLYGDRRSYGATFPPVRIAGNRYYSAQMLVDNDFLYDAAVNSAGTVSGTPIVNPVTLVEYNTDWDKGLAVTIAHEYYHAVQLKYTPDYPGGFHAWFELGAVAMEERLAPAVNDYRSYLTSLLPLKTPVSLYASGPMNGDYEGNYANGIFHIFLSHSLGKGFDVPIWEALALNGNNLPSALLTALGGPARWDSLYAAYAAALVIAGLPGSAASPLAFSPDFPLWPRPYFDTTAKGGSTFSMAPLTYRLVAPVASAVTWASHPGIPGSWRVGQSGPDFPSRFLADSLVPLSPGGALGLAVANGSFSQSRVLALKRGAASSTGPAAFPNPLPSSQSIRFASPAAGSQATLSVVSESGKRVAALTPDPTGSFWTWNLRDPQNRVVPPGIYYYGMTGQPPQTLLVLP